MRVLLVVLVLMMNLNSFSQEDTIIEKSPFLVFQLFTSQGCSSCPPADKLLQQIKEETENKNVVVLSYHVDYWNRLGWIDPFSSKDFTNLQYTYGRKFNINSVYTPQLIVNGKEHFVGSNKRKVKDRLRNYNSNLAKNLITISNLKKDNNIITADYTIEGNTADKKIVVALVLDNKETFIKRGENTNRTIVNHNIVVQETSKLIDTTTGKISIKIPKKFISEKNLHLISFTQSLDLNITGVTRLKI